jgi:hypothetical protein
MSYPSRFVEFFGPAMWKTLQSIAFNFPDKATPEQRKDYIDFFKSVGPVIPCPSCSNHYQEYIKKNPIDAENTESIARWVYDLHDTVNKKNNKKSPSFDAIKNDYTGWDESRHNDLKKLSKSERERKLADPFLGRLPNKKEAMTANNPGPMMPNNSFLIIGIILLLCYMMYRRNQNKNEEKK